jgi:hypothetical protein
VFTIMLTEQLFRLEEEMALEQERKGPKKKGSVDKKKKKSNSGGEDVGSEEEREVETDGIDEFNCNEIKNGGSHGVEGGVGSKRGRGRCQNTNMTGLSSNIFFTKCLEKFAVTSLEAFKTQLGEFKDHKIILTRTSQREMFYYIPFDAASLAILLDACQ